MTLESCRLRSAPAMARSAAALGTARCCWRRARRRARMPTPAPRRELRGTPAGSGCARVTVPLDWSVPGGPAVALAIAEYPADSGQPRLGSLFLNHGGPGVSGVAALRQRGIELSAEARGASMS